VRRAVPALRDQLLAGDQLIVVDNASSDGTADAVRELAPEATVIEPGSNLGFAAGCNRGAAAAAAELLLFLNPDATAAAGFRDAIAAPIEERRGWAAWQGLVTAERGRVVNTRGGRVHFSGIAWAGGAGESLESEPPAGEPGFVSGACLAIPRQRFEEAGGFAEEFFLYHEDVDLSLRLRLAGGALGVVPEARVDHEYEFEKGPGKWRRLERNRWATLVRTYPGALLAVLAPALAITELALLPISLAGGWFAQKAGSWADLARAAPRLWRERRRIQATRAVPAREFARALTAELESPYLGPTARSAAVRAGLRAYWLVALALLGLGRGS
jgi:GT2 family glycosyltransferase